MYSDTLDMDFLFDVPVRRPALLSRKMFDVPVRPMDAKGLRTITATATLHNFTCCFVVQVSNLFVIYANNNQKKSYFQSVERRKTKCIKK